MGQTHSPEGPYFLSTPSPSSLKMTELARETSLGLPFNSRPCAVPVPSVLWGDGTVTQEATGNRSKSRWSPDLKCATRTPPVVRLWVNSGLRQGYTNPPLSAGPQTLTCKLRSRHLCRTPQADTAPVEPTAVPTYLLPLLCVERPPFLGLFLLDCGCCEGGRVVP